jgi:raffinose/stachyose/melibiose transport system permease protein
MRMKYNQNYMAPRNPVVVALNYFFLLAAAIIIICPIMIIVNISFKSNEEYFYSGPFQLAKSILNIENYKIVFELANFIRGFENTGIIIIVSVTGSIIMGLMVSYVLGRFDFKFKAVVANAFILATIIPTITTQVATFTVIKSLGIYNTLYAGIVLYVATDIISIYVFLQYISKIPKSLDESAMIDGASYIRIFFSIIIPQMIPAIVTMAIIKSISIYNDIFIPYIYMPKSTLRTVATTIQYFSQDRNSQWNLMAAAILIAMIPTLIIYAFCQKLIISGLTEGAVKE